MSGGGEKVINIPSGKDAGIFLVGVLIGFFTPGVFTQILTYMAQNSLGTGYIENKVAALGENKVEGGNAIDILIFLGGLIVVLFAVAKGAKILFRVGLGVAIGLALRVVLSIAGFHIPFTTAEYTIPNSTAS